MDYRSLCSRVTVAVVCFILAVMSGGCREEEVAQAVPDKQVVERTVAVVLPMERGLEEHWRRSLALYLRNMERAYKSQEVIVRLNFELYDELTEDLETLCKELGSRDDIYAVVGGLYSSDAAVMTYNLASLGKTLFTPATSEELVRAYASTGYLWAMTETDITQCEVLLSRVVNYGGRSVALVAKADDIYGKTFIDWFAFQAKELGLVNMGVFTYGAEGPGASMAEAMALGADYVVCVPSEIAEIESMLESASRYGKASADRPPSRLLFSDTAYGTDVLSLLGEKGEGLEGVAFGADPESGFDISYRTFYGVPPTTGEAQLYDAVMLLGYAAWYQYLHPGSSLRSALRDIVSGEDVNMGSWTGEDMSLVVDALARGDSPFIRGASGPLRFDRKIFTNVLATTYYSYRVYEGAYIILDYNTSDGGNRTDATLAGWNWKARQMQEFDDYGSFYYPEHHDSWAILVAASKTWQNYRHQADVLAIYQQLKAGGFDDDHIILIAEDDIAFCSDNPDAGIVRVVPGGSNVYAGAEIDYRLSDLSPSDFLSILKGERNERLPEVVEADENDNIFVFWSGHGVPGAMCWGDLDFGMTAERLRPALEDMAAEGRFRKLLMMVEACYSGAVMEGCEGIPGVLFITAANGEETSKADIFNGELKIWMTNRFTSTFIEQITANASISMRDLYYRLFLNTVGSHVMVYNARWFGNLYSSDMSEFVTAP